MIIVVIVYFIIVSVRELLDTPSYNFSIHIIYIYVIKIHKYYMILNVCIKRKSL